MLGKLYASSGHYSVVVYLLFDVAPMVCVFCVGPFCYMVFQTFLAKQSLC